MDYRLGSRIWFLCAVAPSVSIEDRFVFDPIEQVLNSTNHMLAIWVPTDVTRNRENEPRRFYFLEAEEEEGWSCSLTPLNG